MNIFLEGFFLGLAYAMPIGPQNLFVIESALFEQLKKSYVTAAIISIVDVSLGLLCLFGVGQLFHQNQFICLSFFLIGSIFLFYLATKLILTKGLPITIKRQSLCLKTIIKNSLFLTLLNPQAIIDGSLLLGSYRAALADQDLFCFSYGTMLASPLWFFSLTTIIRLVKKKLPEKIIQWIHVLCSIALYYFSVHLLLIFFRSLLNENN